MFAATFRRQMTSSAIASRIATRGFKTVGFIGLGNMGGPMARNLVNAGHDVVVFDLNETAVQAAVDAGARRAASPAEVAALTNETASQSTRGGNIIITMLPTPAHVRAVYTGSDLAAAGAAVAAGAPVSSSEVVPGAGLLDIAQAGTILMDCSTIDPASAGTLSAAARERGLRALDAPVSGGVTGAAAGTLTFMLGGSPDDAAAVDPLLASMGKARLHCGDLPGSGQAAKLCNNMLLAVTMVGAAEAMKLGAHLGLDSARLAGVLNVSTGRSWSTDTYNPAPGALANENLPANRDYAGGFANVLMNKDLGLALSAARREDVATPISDLAGRIYATLAEDPAYRGLDFGSVYKWLGSQKRADCSAAEAQEKKVSC